MEVAQDLLGTTLIFKEHRALITETEAYRGTDDAASHAFKGPTPRSQVMFGAPGMSYVYFIYGMYHCLNIATEPEGHPSAVLIRGVTLLDTTPLPLNGPGKLCREMGINLEDNQVNLLTSPHFYIETRSCEKRLGAQKITATPRIGIKKDIHKLWRFILV